MDLGTDTFGNLTRIENELAKLPARLEAAKTKQAETTEQLAKPFAFEDELKEKTDRLNALNIELNLSSQSCPEKTRNTVPYNPRLKACMRNIQKS